MALFLKQTMPAKGMYLKSNKIFYLIFFIFYTISNSVESQELDNEKIIRYLESLGSFSASFIQNDGDTISEGRISLGKSRVRVDYEIPSKILIVLDEDKAMYYNYELDEDEFFNPKDTSAWFFFDIFNNPNFILESNIFKEENNIIIEKRGDNEIGKYLLRVYFENNPLIIRKIELVLEDALLILSIFNHNHNTIFDDNFFKLINPFFFN